MKKLQFFLVLLFIGFAVQAQTDSLVLSNNDLIVGEIKNMDKNIIGIETDYSDVDFKIKWDNVKRVYSKTNYLITLSDGRRYNGRIRSLNDSIVEIDTQMPETILSFSKKNNKVEETFGQKVDVQRHQIVYLNALDDTFWSRLSFNFDVGTNLTKANDFRQFTFNTAAGYLADRWKANLNFNSLRSTQAEVEPIKRTELGASYNYFLPHDWYLMYSLNILSNTEQLLDLRTSNMIGAGNYVVHTNKAYLGFSAGVNFNNEKFQGDESSTQSGEAFFGAQYNIFDIGDLDLMTTVVGYPSLTEKGRFRTDFKFDIRYEFKFDLYFKVGTTMNYDNQPTEGASDLDYIFQTTVGWSL
ncbi:DUF481 domain-containing protein [Algoriphagus aestuariicola]|jgi:hypothetical protein|uniref:DUF481 domain-containing protein n=1 Tax=Algoriphagus aestuariicola TaxID=1852016 RepID=A0ABS3BTF2_9BACT|nr:DUF481 domain-containing protein [Algoriphagus aestuariicola]MBN7802587.1 DUF481 domain-containing protein [Algoriphagus aestuariicola]